MTPLNIRLQVHLVWYKQIEVLDLLAKDKEAINTVYNVAFGERTDLNELVSLLKTYLSEFDPQIANIDITYGPERKGDVPHSLASIEKAKKLLGYAPQFDIKTGLKNAVNWYWNNLK